MRAKIEIREGYSSVEHFAPEVVRIAEAECADCQTKSGAIRSARAAISRVLRHRSPNGSGQSYSQYGLSLLSFAVRV